MLLGEGYQVDYIYTDFKKAFDKVDHFLLLIFILFIVFIIL